MAAPTSDSLPPPAAGIVSPISTEARIVSPQSTSVGIFSPSHSDGISSPPPLTAAAILPQTPTTAGVISLPSTAAGTLSLPSTSAGNLPRPRKAAGVFKSRLQEYAQKMGIPIPEYATVMEGPSHKPAFRSTVTVDDVSYDSLPGCCSRKAAEQSAAEVALLEISKSGNINCAIYQPVHETGLCKSLLQEYAQKMSFPIPSYEGHLVETPGKMTHFLCVVEIGGIRYVGEPSKTKKEAEIKAARAALLAIQSIPNGPSSHQPACGTEERNNLVNEAASSAGSQSGNGYGKTCVGSNYSEAHEGLKRKRGDGDCKDDSNCSTADVEILLGTKLPRQSVQLATIKEGVD